MSFEYQNNSEKNGSYPSVNLESLNTGKSKEEGFICWALSSFCAIFAFIFLIFTLYLTLVIIFYDELIINISGNTFTFSSKSRIPVPLVSCLILSIAFFQIRKFLRRFRC